MEKVKSVNVENTTQDVKSEIKELGFGINYGDYDIDDLIFGDDPYAKFCSER